MAENWRISFYTLKLKGFFFLLRGAAAEKPTTITCICFFRYSLSTSLGSNKNLFSLYSCHTFGISSRNIPESRPKTWSHRAEAQWHFLTRFLQCALMENMLFFFFFIVCEDKQRQEEQLLTSPQPQYSSEQCKQCWMETSTQNVSEKVLIQHDQNSLV